LWSWLATGVPAWVLLWALLPAAAGAEDSAAVGRAAAIVAALNLKPGVCCVPRAHEGALALTLAKATGGWVLAQVADRATADHVRQQALAADVSEHLVVEPGLLTAIPLETGGCDLVVIDDLAAADLTPALASEVTRVLAPYRGIAVVGSANAGLGAAALLAWARRLGPAAEAVPGSGTWVTMRMAPLKGGDDWSHYNHGPDGDPVSNDTSLVSGPSHLRWYQGPYLGDKWGTYVVGGGRIFWANASGPDGENAITARALSDGHYLWGRRIDRNFGHNGSHLLVEGDTFYCEDRNGVAALDAETGKELRRLEATTSDRQVRWILLSDGVLVTLTGPPLDVDNKSGPTPNQSWNNNAIGDELCGWDPKQGRRLWTFHEAQIDPPKLVARGPKLFLYAKREYAASLDIHTGQVRWKTEAPINSDFSEGGMGFWVGLNDFYTPDVCAIASQDAYIINLRVHLQSQSFDADTGKLLWNHMHGKEGGDDAAMTRRINSVAGMLPYWLVIGDTIYAHSMFQYYQGDGHGTIDVRTGADRAPGFSFDYGGCGHFTANAAGLFFGQYGEIYDNNTHQKLRTAFTKGACGVSTFVADGDVIKPSGPCGCCMEWRGFINTRPAEAVVADPPAARLERGDAAQPVDQRADAKDWPTYRANEARSAASAAMVPTSTPVVRWTYAPKGIAKPAWIEGAPAPAIAVGSSVYLGTADGAVVCLDTADGSERWRFDTCGRIWSAPTWDAGRLFVGSADGWLYCLNAQNGGLLWRYRVAPIDSRILIWDRLSSRWPAMPCPLVHDGVVYAVAGMIAELDGNEMVALDAATGRLIWQSHWGAKQPDAMGNMAWGDGSIWLKGGDWGNARIDAATGACTQMTEDLNTHLGNAVHGKDIGYLGRGWLVCGGREHYLPGWKYRQDRAIATYVHCAGMSGANGVAITLPDYDSAGIPCWDAHDLVVGTGDGVWYANPALMDQLAELSATRGGGFEYKLPEAVKGKAQWLKAAPNSGAQGSRTLCPMLAANAVILIGGGHDTDGRHFCLDAVTRDTRENAWWVALDTLPALPVWDGPCIDREGDVLVPLQDGSLACIGAPRN
jgi:outer membrane protein assembly factor BamB